MSIEEIQNHFDEEAEQFDTNIRKLIPQYNQMVEILVSLIPYTKDSHFSIIDLGCGTGTISKAIQSSFPNADITCVDVAGNMLEMAKRKLDGKVHCIQANFQSFVFPSQYNVIVSSLALHHLETDEDKLEFYHKIYDAISNNGIFINIDIMSGANKNIEHIYMEKWKDFMLQNVSEDEMMNKWLPSHEAEDRPMALSKHLDMLAKCGFDGVDVIYKYFNYAVYVGCKSDGKA